MSNDLETKTDTDQLVKDTYALPVIGADVYQHVGRYAGAMVLSCFEQMGGLPRMKAWADTNPTDFYTKLFPKMITRSQAVDVTGSLTIDDALDRIDSEAKVIEGAASVVSDDWDL